MTRLCLIASLMAVAGIKSKVLKDGK